MKIDRPKSPLPTGGFTSHRRTKKFLFYLLAALLGGCIPVMSLHPLFTDENLIFEEKLLGTWADDPNSPETTNDWEFKRVVDSPENEWEFKRPGKPEKTYKLVFINNEDGTKGSFFAHLVKLKDRLFLDLYPSQLPCAKPDPNDDWLFNALFLTPGHSFMIIDSIEPRLKMRSTNDNEMEKLLKRDPNALKHELVDERLILTASTKELQAFVLKYADDSRVFSDEIILSRKKAKALQESGEQDPND
ncbi:MAG: hypothetical protein ACYS6W_06180 [Planctomycetota bacterium]|jgi:hypothetical protein